MRGVRPGVVALLAALAMVTGGLGQYAPVYDEPDEPLLPEYIETSDIEMRGKYVREMRISDDLMVLQFNGRFRLTFGHRELSATNAVVWIEARRTAEEGRHYFEASVYLSEDAEIVEPGGTFVQDRVLYVSSLRTFGQIVKFHDHRVSDDLTRLPLYQQAQRVREFYEQTGEPTTGPDVVRLADLVAFQPGKPPAVIRYRLRDLEPAETDDGQTVLVSTGGVYFSRSGAADAPVLEIGAERCVIFLGRGGDDDEELSEADVDGELAEDSGARWQSELQDRLNAVYLEGDVTLSLGASFVRAERLFYDFGNERALILDAVFRTEFPERNIPLYVRAAEIRQSSARQFSALDARVTTDEFYTPHYHIGAEEIEIYDRTPRDDLGRSRTPVAGTFTLLNATYNIEGVPIAWWPYARGDFETSEQLLRRLATGYSSDYGASFESSWYLFGLLGVERPPGYDATLRLDYFSKRGPAAGIDADYDRENYFGLFRSYFIQDDGEDDLGPLRRHEEEPDTNQRGRVLWRHKQQLANNWEAQLELSWISDPYFLETYERSEYWEGKEQETAIYLKRTGDTDALTLLANWRMLEYLTQTEHLPDLTYRRIGDLWFDPVVLYHESRVGVVRYRTDDRRFFDHPKWTNDTPSNATFRTDFRQEAELPLKLGPVNIVPFATVRGTFWDEQPLDRGSLWRGFGLYGVRGSTIFHRVFEDLRSELFDINGIRHIVKPDFAAWWSHSNTRSEHIYPFDEGIETIDDFHGATFGLHQVWQTRRGIGDQRRIVDLLTVNLETGFFGEGQPNESTLGYANILRPEDSRTNNYFSGDVIYRISDTTSLLYDFNIDLNDWRFDRHNVSLAVERLPRLAYIIGARYAGDIDYAVLGGGFNYKLNEKHIVTYRNWFDVDRGRIGEISVAYVRKLPRWYVAVNFEWDEVFDDVTITVSVWPEGIPEWTIGSRRFSGLGTTTGIRP